MRKFNSHSIPTRLNLLFAIVILLFMTIIGRLLYMQVVNKDFYEAKLASASQTRVTTGSARGEIYDAAGKPLVENTVKQVVAFTRSNKMTATDLKDISNKLLNYVSVTSPELTDRQIADYYLADPATYKKTVEGLPKDKRFDSDGNLLSESELYNNAAESIASEKMTYSEDEKKAIYIFNQLNAVGNFATGNIQTDPLDDTQIAVIASASKELPGISISTSWDRKVLDTSLSSIVGSVSSEKSGLPAEDVDEYLKKGYSLNDRVGTSYLEEQYETVLSGTKTVVKSQTNTKGEVVNTTETYPGKGASNLVLTIDTEFQKKIEETLTNYKGYNAKSTNKMLEVAQKIVDEDAQYGADFEKKAANLRFK